MDVFSLENEEYGNIFITQEPSQKVNEELGVVESEDLVDRDVMDIEKLCGNDETKASYQPEFSDISDDDFEESGKKFNFERRLDLIRNCRSDVMGSLSDGENKKQEGRAISQICGLNSRRRLSLPKVLGTSKAVSKLSCFKSVSDTKLADLKKAWIKPRTFNKMQWGVRAFKDWRNDKLSQEDGFDPILLEVDLDVVSSLMKANMNHALCKFLPEVTKKKDGSDYLGKTLYEMLVSIQKHLNQNNVPWHFLDDPEFVQVRNVLDNTMKERAKLNLGMIKRQAECISMEYEEHLWRSGVLGEDTPDKLRDTVLFILGINLALRAGDKHHELRCDSPDKPSQLSFERDIKSGKRCLVYREDTVTKTNDGGISNLKKECKVVWVFPSENINRRPVRLVDKYVSLCPEVNAKNKKCNFYLRSLEKSNPAQWYKSQAIGKNSLSKTVSNLLKSGNLDGYFTNHSLRCTSATRLFQAGVEKKIVREVSDALDKYQITSNEQKQHVSNVLNLRSTPKKIHKDKVEPKSPVPSLEFSVTDNSKSSTPSLNCSCKRKEFNLGDAQQLTTMINELVSKQKSRRAKIRLEIEFSD